MNTAEVKQLAQSLALYAAYYRVKLEDAVLAMYAEDLADLDFVAVKGALDAYRKNPKNRIMPLPAMIREVLCPEVDPDSAAREIAARINAAVVKFGYPNARDAQAFIGERGWAVVDRQGGWDYICRNLGITLDPGVFQAQVREQVKADLKFTPTQMGKAIGIALAPGIRPGLQSIGEIMSSSLPERKA